ncbi:MAG: hypothetical protein ACQKBT_09935 [Puniceicoccales bacterium]
MKVSLNQDKSPTVGTAKPLPYGESPSPRVAQRLLPLATDTF